MISSLRFWRPSFPEAAKLWVTYLASWTAWNHVRAVAALGGRNYLHNRAPFRTITATPVSVQDVIVTARFQGR
jgi:hypothetical protein